MDARRMKRAGGLAVMVALLCALCACGTPQKTYDADSSIPWNAPEQWEQQPQTGAPFAW